MIIDFKKFKNKFDAITSKNGQDWLLALNWIFVFEFTSTIIEYEFIQKAKTYIEPLSNSLTKELSIAVLIVLFIWYSVYNFIYMQRDKFFLFTLYISICIYLLVTNDVSFNLLLHNLNPLEIFIDGIGFYMMIQVLLKCITFYLLYKMIIAIKNKKSENL